ncbi:hypothetical protein ACWEU6_20845, partial [Streptosporangium sandarakinum]
MIGTVRLAPRREPLTASGLRGPRGRYGPRGLPAYGPRGDDRAELVEGRLRDLSPAPTEVRASTVEGNA